MSKFDSKQIDTLVEYLVQEADAKAGFSETLASYKEDDEDLDTSLLSAIAKKKYKKLYKPEAFENERDKIEKVYEAVDGSN